MSSINELTMLVFVTYCVCICAVVNGHELPAAVQGHGLSKSLNNEVHIKKGDTESTIHTAFETTINKELPNNNGDLVKHEIFESTINNKLLRDYGSYVKHAVSDSMFNKDMATREDTLEIKLPTHDCSFFEHEAFEAVFKQMNDKINGLQMLIVDLEKTVAKQNVVKLEENIFSMQTRIMHLEEIVADQVYIIEKIPSMEEHIINLEMSLAKQNVLNNDLRDQILEFEKYNAEMKHKLTETQNEFEMIEYENIQLKKKLDFLSLKKKQEVVIPEKRKRSNETLWDIHAAARFDVPRTKKPYTRNVLNSISQNLGHTNLDSKLRHGSVPVQAFRSGSSALSRDLQGRQVTEPNEGVAFSVFVINDITGLKKDDVIKFDGIMINEGNGYDKTTGMFTAPRSGLYLFSFFIEDYHDQDLWVLLRENNSIRSQAVAEPYEENQNIMGGNTVLLRVTEGSRVWVSISRGNRVQDNWTTFSGVLLH